MVDFSIFSSRSALLRLSAALGVIAALAIFVAVPGSRAQTISQETSAGPIALERVAALSRPWGMDFLPDGRLIVTERDGRLLLVNPSAAPNLRVAEIAGGPEVWARGQGGLLDVAVSPDFAQSGIVFLSYSAPTDNGAQTAVDRAELTLDDAPRLSARETIFRQAPGGSGGRHFGSRIVIAPDGLLFITIGDRGARDRAQDMDAHNGKVVRIDASGGAPQDNPFIGAAGAAPEIWSLGHRNAQGAAIRPSDGSLWTVEHGARGGDEINKPEPGLNYGWPIISYGEEYSGGQIGRGTSAPGLEQPIHYWDPSIAPSGLAFYQGPLFADWEGDLLVGALKFRYVARLEMDGDRVVSEERLFEGAIGRVRDVAAGPDGAIWILTDEDDGGLWRATPSR